MGKSKEQFIEQSEFESLKNEEVPQEEITKEESEYYNLIGKIQRKELALSYSSLKQFYNTPRSFINYKLSKFERTPAMVFGSLLDCLILTPENFEKEYVILNTTPSSVNQIGFCNDYILNIENGVNESDAKLSAYALNYKQGGADKVYDSLSNYIKAKLSGKECISSADKLKANQIAKSVLSNPTAQKWLEQAETIQEKLEWEYNGYKNKGFLDVRGKYFIMDLKYKSQSSDINDFQWDFKKLHYDLQAGMYCKAVQILNLIDNPEYYIMVYDAKGEVSVIKIDHSYILYGQHKYDFCLQEFKRCTSENSWQLSHDFYGQNNGVFNMIKPKFAEIKGILK